MPLTKPEPVTFTITCRCGERFHADQRSIGRSLKCRCGRTITVRRPRKRRRARIQTAARMLTSVVGGIVNRSRRAWRAAAAPRRRRRPLSRIDRAVARPLAFLTWAYVASVCAIAVVLWTLGDRWWVATVLLFFGRWVFLLPLVLLLPAAVLFSRRLVGLLVLAGLVVLGPIMGVRTGWRAWLPTPDGLQFRVVSFNADGGELLARDLPNVLAAWRPDVVALQECGPYLVPAVRAVTGWHHHDANGLCLLSRFPIRDSSVMDRRALETVRNSGEDIGGSGAVVRYAIETPYGMIQLTNLHLETPRKGFDGLAAFDLGRLRSNTELRDIESHLARGWVDQGVAKEPVPVLVAGDFNTPVESRIFQEHWGGDLHDAFSRAGHGLGMTKYNGWIRVRIDHVLLGRWWSARRAVIGDDLGSDHRPLIVDLVLMPAK
jgi:vancomycin resistance protein VanJ